MSLRKGKLNVTETGPRIIITKNYYFNVIKDILSETLFKNTVHISATVI